MDRPGNYRQYWLLGAFIAALIALGVISLRFASKSSEAKNGASGESAPSTASAPATSSTSASTPRENFATIHGAATETVNMRPIRIAPVLWPIPKHYDCRVKFGKQGVPNSSGIMGCISAPMDQGSCGSSWAFAVAQVVSDRIRIESSVPAVGGMALAQDNLSPSWLMKEGNQCLSLRTLLKGNKSIACESGEMCQSGTPVLAFRFLKEHGGVGIRNEGNAYNPKVDLYQIHEFYSAASNIGGEINYYFYPGQKEIRPETEFSYKETVDNMSKEMMTRGPLVAVMNVYSDFPMLYRRGVKNDDVYMQPPGSIPKKDFATTEGVRYLGDQAVALVGFGEKTFYSQTIKYWIVRMTWGDDWNGDGYFKIERGRNCCNLELEALGSWGYSILAEGATGREPRHYEANEPNPVPTKSLGTIL